jgi:hypothetical protein
MVGQAILAANFFGNKTLADSPYEWIWESQAIEVMQMAKCLQQGDSQMDFKGISLDELQIP